MRLTTHTRYISLSHGPGVKELDVKLAGNVAVPGDGSDRLHMPVFGI
jgi:hypothetical protein